ncbi:MAG: replication initiator protein [Arizlama microvirus]|nr:MAG: replication initiator protein [Arizlama microvirus]
MGPFLQQEQTCDATSTRAAAPENSAKAHHTHEESTSHRRQCAAESDSKRTAMPCTSPIAAFQDKNGGPLHFQRHKPGDRELKVPCNQCGDCRTKRLSDWGQRCVHHASQFKENSFLTLTYDDANLPDNGSLYKPHLQGFFKRLRYHFPVRKLSYYACGEYGERTQRAHYHVCLFNADFQDKIAFRKIGEHQLYLSAQLTEIWGHGNTSLGSLTYQTACYTAAYVMKRTLGKGCPKYVKLDEETGLLTPLVQPFAVMSLRPAIASDWMHKYHADIYGHNKDTIVQNTKKLKPARYYDRIYDRINPDHMAEIKQERIAKHIELTDNQLRARAEITHARKIMKTQI